MKKDYLKPTIEYVNLYSEEKITAIPLQDGVAYEMSERNLGGGIIGGSMGEGPSFDLDD